MAGRFLDFLAQGDAADRPADPTPNIVTGALAMWYSQDTNVLSFWNEDTVAWVDLDLTALGTPVTQEQVEDWVGGFMAGVSPITVTYNDVANTLEVSTSLTQYTDEMSRDAIGTALVEGAGIDITINDAGDTITIASTVTQVTQEIVEDWVGALIQDSDSIDSTYVDGSSSLTLSVKPRAINPEAASYTLVLADAWSYTRMNVAGANNLTVPLNATVAFPIGTEIPFISIGAGQTTVVATGGVTINTPETLKLRKQWSTGLLTKVGTDEWDLTGDLELL